MTVNLSEFSDTNSLLEHPGLRFAIRGLEIEDSKDTEDTVYNGKVPFEMKKDEIYGQADLGSDPDSVIFSLCGVRQWFNVAVLYMGTYKTPATGSG